MRKNSAKVINGFYMTDHAEVRCNQRGVSKDILGRFLEVFDLYWTTPSESTELRLSKKEARRLQKNGAPARVVEKMCKLCVIVNGATIITVINDPTRAILRQAA